MNPNQRVIDETGAVHVLSKKLGSGGQGEVWLTEGARRIVKLVDARRDAEALRRQLTFVRRLDLRELHVAKPIAVLKPPHVGYVAEFLEDMVPLKSLLEPQGSNLLPWHIATGGLRRRLRLLAHAGEALLGLHARGVVYADVSHHNVFVSESTGAVEAWLIDLDNLSHDSDPRHALYTPGYGAPEVVDGSAGCTSLSDAWAFAVLVWRTLTLSHPFVGDLVDGGEPELEAAAYAGELPWVGHGTDDRNRCSTGFPPELVLAKRLVELARKTFEAGLRDRTRRTSVADWVDRLHAAADQAIVCPACSGTYFVTESACPWCDEPRPRVVRLRVSRWQPGTALEKTSSFTLGHLPLTEEMRALTRRVTEGVTGLAGRTPHVELAAVARGVAVRVAPGCKAWVAPVADPAGCHEVTTRGRIVPDRGWMMFFETPDAPQRIGLIEGNA